MLLLWIDKFYMYIFKEPYVNSDNTGSTNERLIIHCASVCPLAEVVAQPKLRA